MSEHKPENDCGLIIDPELLADIQRQCRQRAAELEATGELAGPKPAPGSLQAAIPAVCAPLPISEAERFAAAIQEMPGNVRRFFDQEDLVSPPTSWESDEGRAERERLTALGGWAGS